jgi:hypothetical protein
MVLAIFPGAFGVTDGVEQGAACGSEFIGALFRSLD